MLKVKDLLEIYRFYIGKSFKSQTRNMNLLYQDIRDVMYGKYRLVVY